MESGELQTGPRPANSTLGWLWNQVLGELVGRTANIRHIDGPGQCNRIREGEGQEQVSVPGILHGDYLGGRTLATSITLSVCTEQTTAAMGNARYSLSGHLQ